MPKKGENIYRRKDGRWEGRYIKGHLADGKTKYAYVYGKTYSDVKQKLIDDRIAFAQGKDTARRKTKYRDILHDWLAMSRMRIKESTYSRYVHLSETHIEPYLGTLTLDCLTTQAVEHHIIFLIKALKKTYPQANIVAVDYDPGASEVNQLNRIKLMLAQAKNSLAEK